MQRNDNSEVSQGRIHLRMWFTERKLYSHSARIIHLLPYLDGRMLDWSFVTPTGDSFSSEYLMWAC